MKKYPYPALFSFVLCGAFIRWLLSGMKGKFNDKMSSYADSDSGFFKNLFIGIVVAFLIYLLVISVV
jgi:hypothetical protein